MRGMSSKSIFYFFILCVYSTSFLIFSPVKLAADCCQPSYEEDSYTSAESYVPEGSYKNNALLIGGAALIGGGCGFAASNMNKKRHSHHTSKCCSEKRVYRGKRGHRGTQGAQGIAGTPGAAGTTGSQGVPGPQGPAGASPFIVDNDNTLIFDINFSGLSFLSGPGARIIPLVSTPDGTIVQGHAFQVPTEMTPQKIDDSIQIPNPLFGSYTVGVKIITATDTIVNSTLEVSILTTREGTKICLPPIFDINVPPGGQIEATMNFIHEPTLN